MRLRLAAFAALVILLPAAAPAHDSWINRGGYRNAKGEHCCSEHDCHVQLDAVQQASGWAIRGEGSASEFVPYSEAMPSPDGQLWICRRSDHTRRCVFGPPPGS